MQAIGRWGNFFNQELYGPPTDLPWGIAIDCAHRVVAVPVHDVPARDDRASTRCSCTSRSAGILGAITLLWIARRYGRADAPGRPVPDLLHLVRRGPVRARDASHRQLDVLRRPDGDARSRRWSSSGRSSSWPSATGRGRGRRPLGRSAGARRGRGMATTTTTMDDDEDEAGGDGRGCRRRRGPAKPTPVTPTMPTRSTTRDRRTTTRRRARRRRARPGDAEPRRPSPPTGARRSAAPTDPGRPGARAAPRRRRPPPSRLTPDALEAAARAAAPARASTGSAASPRRRRRSSTASLRLRRPVRPVRRCSGSGSRRPARSCCPAAATC